MAKTKLAAYIEVDGRRVRLFPRSKKTSFFSSEQLAINAMERAARPFNRDVRGIMVPAGTPTDEIWNAARTFMF